MSMHFNTFRDFKIRKLFLTKHFTLALYIESLILYDSSVAILTLVWCTATFCVLSIHSCQQNPEMKDPPQIIICNKRKLTSYRCAD
jgi:hypothetical protein